jgi:sucrose-6-phosphate hydrolase SacC (GH32 family)
VTDHTVLDFGLWYAAKGTTLIDTDPTQHVVFGWIHTFDGRGPMEMIALQKSCGAQYTLPRLVGLSADGVEVRLRPLSALVHLRLPKSASTAHHEVMSAATLLASRRTVASVSGTAVHISVLLPCALSAHADFFGVHLLSGKNESTLVGWDSKLNRVAIDRSRTSAAGIGASDPMTGKLKGGCPLGQQLNLTAVVDGGILEVYVNDRFAITAALWPSEDIGTEERQLGLIAVPKSSTSRRPEGSGALPEGSVVFSVWKLQTKGVLSPEDPYGAGAEATR